MARGPKKWNASTIERLTKEGRGKGNGVNYKPWIDVFTISSIGNSHRIQGIKVPREYHLLSNTERDVFVWCEWQPNVVDIREQYPLDRDLTLEIAAAYGLRHPCYPGTNEPTVMTVDFLLTVIINGAESLIAISAKRDDEAEDENSMTKLEIIRRYFEGGETPHHIIFHTKIPQTLIDNISWIRSAWIKEGEIEPYSGFYQQHSKKMIAELATATRNMSLTEYCSNFDVRHGTESGTGLRVARMLMYERSLMPDMNNSQLSSAPLSSFIVTAQPGKLRAIK